MKIKSGTTESGDRYSGTAEAWARYRDAWDRSDMDLVMAMETGKYDDFYYDPDE